MTQYAGRLHRLYDGKSEVRISDYVDLEVAMLARMFNKRCRGYESIGYEIVQPLTQIPGWPEQIRLPVNPKWQERNVDSGYFILRFLSDDLATNLPEVLDTVLQVINQLRAVR